MKEELQKLGLTRNESEVYLTVLELGSTSAGKVIKKTKLHRNIVYDNLDKLIEKGLVTFVLIRGIKHFEATSPNELKEFIEKQKNEILAKEKLVNQIIPQIAKIKTVSKPQEAAIFKGKKAVKNLLEEMALSKTDLLIFATGWGLRKTMGNHYFDQWHLKLRENKVGGRAVLSIKAKTNDKLPYKLRYLKDEFIQPSSICIYEDKVVTLIWDEEPIAVLIISEKNAESYRAYFEVLWKMAKP
jgi:sugar-specific transcriptional regulator TrmB